MFLNFYRFKGDIDQIDEPLNHLSMGVVTTQQSADDSDQKSIMGFLETDSEKFESHDEEIPGRHKRLRASLAQGLGTGMGGLDRRPNRGYRSGA